MVVIGHEAVGMADPVVSLIDMPKGAKEVFSVLVVLKYRVLVITPGGDMIYGVWIFDT
jgi:hypothetical protein